MIFVYNDIRQILIEKDLEILKEWLVEEPDVKMRFLKWQKVSSQGITLNLSIDIISAFIE